MTASPGSFDLNPDSLDAFPEPLAPHPSEPELLPLTKKGCLHGSRRTRLAGLPQRRYTPQQRLLLLDTWTRSGLSATDFASVCGVPATTLYGWRRRFLQEGPSALEDKARRPEGSRLPDATQRAILLLKSQNPDWGVQRLHDVLLRSEGFHASPGAIQRLLLKSGYEVVDTPRKRHPDKPRRFERARPNQLWQTDLFSLVLKRSGRRVHMVAFMDDHSRFVVGYALSASASGHMVREALLAACERYGAPEEVLTDNGTQYHSWRGQSQFRKLCDRRGIKQIVARPRHPQTLGKVERFWSTLWQECLKEGVFQDLNEAQLRVGHFIDHTNFQRPHQGIGGLVPADRFFGAEQEVRARLEAQVAKNARELAQHGLPRKTLYLTGKVGDVGVSLHSEGQRVVLTREDGPREVVDLGAPGRRAGTEEAAEGLPRPTAAHPELPLLPGEVEADAPLGPGASKLDEVLVLLGAEEERPRSSWDWLEGLSADDFKDEAPDEEPDDLADERSDELADEDGDEGWGDWDLSDEPGGGE